MTEKPFDVAGLGSAIVDIIARCDESLITEQGLDMGSMRLIDDAEAKRLYGLMGPAVESSGGTVPNTCVGLASFGGKAAFMGKVAKDQFGDVFAHDLRAAGVTFESNPLDDSMPTGRCLILVTPDGERTMNTYLGANTELSTAELDPALIGQSKMLYLEGYAFDGPKAKEAFYEAAQIARDAGTTVSLTLSDPFCVERHREDFLDIIRRDVDLLFANHRELLSLYQTEDLTDACNKLKGDCALAAVTRSAKGSLVLTKDETIEIAAEPVSEVVDTTGAGDLYAAGFLYGHARGFSLNVCGRFGSIAAAEVISHIGPRPQTSLAELAAAQNLL